MTTPTPRPNLAFHPETTSGTGKAATPIERILDSFHADSALLIVRAGTPDAAEWLSVERLERCLGPALLGPTAVEILKPTEEIHVVRLRFPGGCGTPMRSLEIHTLRQFFEQRLCEEWAAGCDEQAPFSVSPFAPLSHLDNLQDNITDLNALLEIIVNRQLKPQFQPIVNLRDGKVFGYETLIRGPKDAVLRRPGQMFRVADKARVVSWFDMACMEECLKLASHLDIRHFLFLNMDAEGLSAMSMQERPIALRARDLGISPQSIVIEITERQMVGDFPRLIEDIGQLREQGFHIAIDDAGAGYSSLRAIAEIRPDFVKIDRDLVKSVDVCGERRALLAALSQYARSAGTSVIAEGAETREELAVLIDLGIPYAQGYILGKPADALRGTPRETREFIQARVEMREAQRAGIVVPAGGLARPGLAMEGATPLSEAVRRFAKEPGLTSIAVTEDGQFRGLVTRRQLDHVLAIVKAARAAEMMPAETIAQWMRTDVLTARADAPVSELVLTVIARHNVALDSDVVILDDAGVYQGVLAMRSLMEAAASRPARMARYADSLTGLPGRVPLEREVAARIEAEISLGVIRLDLNHLARVNEQFGLARGDELVLALAEALTSASRRFGQPRDLVSHLGGDNFLVLTGAEQTPALCQAIVEAFEEIAPRCVMEPPHAGAPGSQLGVSRSEFCSLSVAAATNRSRRIVSVVQVMTSLQDAMRAAKAQPGTRFVIDSPSAQGR